MFKDIIGRILGFKVVSLNDAQIKMNEFTKIVNVKFNNEINQMDKNKDGYLSIGEIYDFVKFVYKTAKKVFTDD